MKKIVYVCGNDGFSCECEILYNGSMVFVKQCKEDDLIGIDIVSMIEMTWDMVDEFIKSYSSRGDMARHLLDIKESTRGYLAALKKIKVVL
jgi:hypothetical protein